MKKVFLVVVAILVALMSSIGSAQKESAKKLTPKQIYEARNDSVVKIITNDGTGTGFFVKNGILVATCYHVIKGATSIEVKGTKGETWQVGFVTFDADSDTVILKLATDSERKPIPLGDYSKLSTGDELCVIGNPLGFLEQSITTGIVSAKRSGKNVNLIQTTAASSPGSSGSPVLNSQGEFVGFISYHFTEGQNLNMAVSNESIFKIWDKNRIPIADFLNTTAQIGTKAEPTAKPEVAISEETFSRIRAGLTGAMARYYSDLAKQEIKWSIDWAETCVNGGSRSTYVDRTYEYANNMVTLMSKNDLVIAVLSKADNELTDEYFEWEKNFGEALLNLARIEGDTMMATIRSTPAQLAASNQATARAQSNVRDLLRALFEIFKKHPVFDWAVFRQTISKPVAYEKFSVNLDGITADPVIEDKCKVGFANAGLPLHSGDRIVSICLSGSIDAYIVDDWIDLQNKLIEWRAKRTFNEVVVSFEGETSGFCTLKIAWPK